MRYAVVSDIHGNLEALTAVSESIDKEGVERVIFLGDAVGYGADPGPALDKIRSEAHVLIGGNHDYVAAGVEEPIGFSPYARKAILWTRERLGPDQREYLAGLDMSAAGEDFTAVHAAPLDPPAWDYLTSEWEARRNFPAFETRLCFIGHSHQPAVFWEDDDGGVGVEAPGLVPLKDGYRYIISVGSVGQPRDGDPRACYVIYDEEGRMVEFLRVDYDIPAAREKILKEGLPPFLAERLALGM